MRELDAGRDVVVNPHSKSHFRTYVSDPKLIFLGWGGLPVCSALDGLNRADREREGKKTAVMKLAFAAGFMVEGVSLKMAIGGWPKSWKISPVSVIRSEFHP